MELLNQELLFEERSGNREMLCKIIVHKGCLFEFSAMRGDSLTTHKPLDGSTPKDLCVADTFTLVTEREQDISNLLQVEGSMPPVWTAESGFSVKEP